MKTGRGGNLLPFAVKEDFIYGDMVTRQYLVRFGGSLVYFEIWWLIGKL
jgi:hypothetical protein